MTIDGDFGPLKASPRHKKGGCSDPVILHILIIIKSEKERLGKKQAHPGAHFEVHYSFNIPPHLILLSQSLFPSLSFFSLLPTNKTITLLLDIIFIGKYDDSSSIGCFQEASNDLIKLSWFGLPRDLD